MLACMPPELRQTGALAWKVDYPSAFAINIAEVLLEQVLVGIFQRDEFRLKEHVLQALLNKAVVGGVKLVGGRAVFRGATAAAGCAGNTAACDERVV